MKPIIRIRLYDENNDVIAELETDLVGKTYDFLKVCDFKYGVMRATYEPNYYNEATFNKVGQAKVLLSVFREKPLLDFIYQGDL